MKKMKPAGTVIYIAINEEVTFDDTCKKWLALDTCKGCLIDFKKGDDNENNKD